MLMIKSGDEDDNDDDDIDDDDIDDEGICADGDVDIDIGAIVMLVMIVMML